MYRNRLVLIAMIAVGGLLHSFENAAIAADLHFAGEVTIRGKPIAGTITLHLDDQFVGSKVKDGKFKVNRIIVGKCRVTLEGKGVPAKYTSEDSTPLIIAVKEGANWHRFELE